MMVRKEIVGVVAVVGLVVVAAAVLVVDFDDIGHWPNNGPSKSQNVRPK